MTSKGLRVKYMNILKGAGVVAGCFLFLTSGAVFGQTPREQAWTALQSGADNKSSEQRSAAMAVLALIPNDSKAAGMAERALQDQDPAVRAAAAVTLGTLKAKSSIPKLQEALKDNDAKVVMSAAKALVDMGGEKGYEVYYALATGERKSGTGLLAGQEQQMQEILHNPKEMAQTAFEQGIGYVPFAGIGYGAFEAIHQNQAKDTLVRATAVRILAKDPDPRSGKALVAATADKAWLVRAAAYDALARRGDPSLLPAVTQGLNDQHYVVTLTAAAAVAQLSSLSKQVLQ